MKLPLPALLCALFLTACGNRTEPMDNVMPDDVPQAKPMSFESQRIADSVTWWWAVTVDDVTGDGVTDLVYIDNNANGGRLVYRTGTPDDRLWETTVIADEPPTGGTFASGDLETGDLDGDGDVDVLAVKHTGEWDNASEPAEVLWYANPGTAGGEWKGYAVGDAKGAVKDLNIGDFDDDGRMDIAVLTFHEENLRIHRQNEDGSFTLLADLTEKGLHEGMDVGDLDADGDADIAANGYIFTNDGKGGFTTSSLDDKWHNQTGDWSANGTKHAVADLNNDGTPEIFVSHSERGGYPLSVYKRGADGSYEETVILDSIGAAHTLNVFDMDNDGDLDIVTGVNKGRAVNIDIQDHPVLVLVNDGSGNFERKEIASGGIYNGRVADLEGDGDYDIFRWPSHEDEEFFVLVNQSL